MSVLYDEYVAGKSPAELSAEIVYAIKRGEISILKLHYLLDELEENNMLNNAVVATVPKDEWNETYLNKLKNEMISGKFSRQYLLYLAEVSEYVNSRNKKSRKSIINAILGVITLIKSWLNKVCRLLVK